MQSIILLALLALAAVLVFVLSRKRGTCAREQFVMQTPVQDVGLSRRGYDMSVVSTYCECAKRCADDEACGAFTYAESAADGLSACELVSRTAATDLETKTKTGSLLTFVSDRCDIPEVA